MNFAISIYKQYIYIYTKTLERLIRPLQFAEFNNTIKKKIVVFKPNVIFVYKGAFPENAFICKMAN